MQLKLNWIVDMLKDINNILDLKFDDNPDIIAENGRVYIVKELIDNSLRKILSQYYDQLEIALKETKWIYVEQIIDKLKYILDKED